jgi:hypothetical protein
MGGTPGTARRLVQRLPLAPGAEHQEEGIHRFAIIDAGPMAPSRVRFPWGEQRLKALPQVVRYPPVPAGFLVVIRHQYGSSRGEFFPRGYQTTT